DTNCDPDGVSFPIPGNDDASRAIALYCDLAARACIDGMASQMGEAGFDLGELEDAPVEDLPAEGVDPAIDPGAAADPPAEGLPAQG
ncbi:MAG: 30S ribosomal protein S2, partial [Pseudomonadota bacterium]